MNLQLCGIKNAMSVSKSATRQIKKLTPESKKGYNKAIEALKKVIQED